MKPLTLFCFAVFAILSSLVEPSSHYHFGTNVEGETLKTRIFIIGATGNFGRLLVRASIKAGYPTIALVRPLLQNDSDTAQLVEEFIKLGVEIVYGDFIIDQPLMIETMKRVDVVISATGDAQTLDQAYIISEIIQAGNIKRFFPSEYEFDVDRVHDPIEPAKTIFENKAKIRRMVEAAGIPHTFVVANGFAEKFWPTLGQPFSDNVLPDINRVTVYEDGKSNIIATLSEEVATYVIKAVDDPRTLNKNLYLRPPANIISFNGLFSLWSNKSGTLLLLKRESKETLIHMVQSAPNGMDVTLAKFYSVAIKNDYDSYMIEPSIGVEATELYPEVKYTTVDEYLDQFVPGKTLIRL